VQAAVDRLARAEYPRADCAHGTVHRGGNFLVTQTFDLAQDDRGPQVLRQRGSPDVQVEASWLDRLVIAACEMPVASGEAVSAGVAANARRSAFPDSRITSPRRSAAA